MLELLKWWDKIITVKFMERDKQIQQIRCGKYTGHWIGHCKNLLTGKLDSPFCETLREKETGT